MSYPTCITLLFLAFSTAIYSQDVGMITASGKDGRIKGIIEAVKFDRVTLKSAAGSTHEVGIDDVEPVFLPQILKWLSLKMPALNPMALRLRATLTKTSKASINRIKQPKTKVTEKSTEVIYQAQISNSGAGTFSDVTLLLLIGYVQEQDTSESKPFKYHGLQLRKTTLEEIAAGKVISAVFEVFRESDNQTINEREVRSSSSGKISFQHFNTTTKTSIESAQLVIFDSSGRLLCQSSL